MNPSSQAPTRQFISICCAALFTVAVGNTARAAERARPNFVFILVDDLGCMDIGANNPDTFYETPNIDRLAREGMRFTQAYAACPVCSPTRSAIMTGKYPVRTGITDYINPAGANQPENWKRPTNLLPAPYDDRLALKEVTIAEALKAGGYATFFAGKWHLGPEGFYPQDQGFDMNKGGWEAGGPYGGSKYFSPYGNPNLPDGPAGEHLPDRLAHETVKFIESHRDKPFLAYLSFYSVHTPLMARKDLEAKYEAKRKKLNIQGPLFGREGERDVRRVQEHAVYAGMVEAMDAAVGVVLDGLDRLGLAETTVVIFTSDNGGLSTSEGSPTSNLPLRAGKGWLYEGGIREPLLVRWPGNVDRGVCDTPVTSPDFYPTLLEIACLPPRPEQHVDGANIAPLLGGGSIAHRSLFWHYPHYGNQGGAPGAAIRDGDYKLIHWFDGDRLELYNLRQDPSESNNLASQQPERVRDLSARLKAWQQRTGARFPTHRVVGPKR